MKIEIKDSVLDIIPESRKEEDDLFAFYKKQRGKRLDAVVSFNTYQG